MSGYRERFEPDWYLMGNGHALHWVGSLHGGRVSQCGILASKDRVYSGHSTTKCKRCLKSMSENGKMKR